VIIGGLALSTVVSLIVVPYVYVLLDSMRQWFLQLLRPQGAAIPLA
jgi:hypothetical protein